MAAVTNGVLPKPAFFKRAGRELVHYPDSLKRYWNLAMVVMTTIVLYYVYFVPGSVTPLMLPDLHMSFFFFLMVIMFSNLVGAFSAFIGGLSDKIGRSNLVIFGLLVVGLLQTFAIPFVKTKMVLAIVYCAIGFVEGIILVVTPALMRDFSPQVGRAAAMGFWALGPVLGSLVTSQVANHTLSHLNAWQDQFTISGIACLVMFAIAFIFLRELSPGIRDQLMVSARETALVEAKAKGIDTEEAMKRPLRTMFRPDLLSSSLAISLFLLLYYASVTVLTLYWAIVFNRNLTDANGINTWYWVFDAVALVVVGAISDKLLVRKPFMLIGAVGTIGVTFWFQSQANHPNTGYYSLVLVVSLLGFLGATAYSPWMANYTQAVEDKNPALAATGLAVWGWLLRIVVAASFLVIPHVISTTTTLVDNQASANALKALQAANNYVGTKKPLPENLRVELDALPPYGTALQTFIDGGKLQSFQFVQLQGLVHFKTATNALLAGKQPASADVSAVRQFSPPLAQLLAKAEQIIPAQHKSPKQWRDWWWVCIGGQVIFLILIFFMPGRWSPSKAREDLKEHEAKMEAERVALHV